MRVSLTELGVELDARVTVLHTEGERRQFVVAGRPVAVGLGVVRVAPDCLRVCGQGLRVLA